MTSNGEATTDELFQIGCLKVRVLTSSLIDADSSVDAVWYDSVARQVNVDLDAWNQQSSIASYTLRFEQIASDSNTLAVPATVDVGINLTQKKCSDAVISF